MRQAEALAILQSGTSVFLTGAPGAGKTYVLNEFVRQARAEGAAVSVTASTGIAATHINGQTIHSWSGVGLANALTDNLIKTIRTRRKRKLQGADILIIDEVSMLHAWLFAMVDQASSGAVRRFLPASAGERGWTQPRSGHTKPGIRGFPRTICERGTQSRRFRH